MTGGRPLRFLAVTLGGWTAARVALLWPRIDSLPSLAHALVPPVVAATLAWTPPPARRAPAPAVAPPAIADVASGRRDAAPVAGAPPPPVAAVRPPSFSIQAPPAEPRQPPPLRPTPFPIPPDRLAVSAWAILRGGRSDAVAGGQLGGSQAGARLTYAIASRLALAARASAPIRGRGAELALGVEWRPTRLPVRVIAERRVAVDGGRGGPTLLVVGGLDPAPIALGFSLDAYGQAGGIARGGRVERFADGAARLARPVARVGAARLELGAGAWGGAQRGAARLDVGPSVAAALPVAGRAVRLTLDWRQRIAGRARPGSGLAFTIGGDF